MSKPRNRYTDKSGGPYFGRRGLSRTKLYVKKGRECFDKQLLLHTKQKENDEVWSVLEDKNVITLVDHSGATLLHFVATYGNADVAEYLIARGISVDARNNLGKTALIIAVARDWTEVSERTIEVLLNAKAGIYATDNEGKSALHSVVDSKTFRNIKILKQFLHKIASDCEDDSELIVKKLRGVNCPLERIVFLCNASVTEIAIKKGCPIDAKNPRTGRTALHTAVQLMDLENVAVLVKYNADVNAKDGNDRTPLCYYNFTFHCQNQQPEIIKILMDKGCKLSLTSDGKMQINSILLEGTRETVRTLFQYDIDLNAKDKCGQTPLHFLALNGHSRIFDELEGKTFDVDARNENGSTPLFGAVISGNVSSVRFLLKRGAKVNVANIFGISPLFCACEYLSKNGKAGATIWELLLRASDI